MLSFPPFEYNSSGDDFAPAVSQNGRQMYFTEQDGSDYHISQTDMKNGRWQSPDELSSSVNGSPIVGTQSLTPDGQFMVFAATKHKNITGYGRTDLFSARKVNGKWTDVQNLGSTINSEAWDSQPSLTSDGSTLYFASDRSGGSGGMDIYMSKRNKDGTWAKATPVSQLNTSGDEASPSIAADNSTLYFASNRAGTVGGFDIYTTRLKNGSFTKPENIGEPINSTADEFYYIALPNSTTAYFASERSGGKGGYDIYKAMPNPEMPNPVVTMRGIVHDAVSNKELGASVIITDLKTRQKVAELHSDDETGEYFVTLTAGRSYSVTATRPDYVFYSERIDVPLEERGREVEKDIDLTPLSGEAATRLLVFFDTDKSLLKDESLADLDRAADLLSSNAAIKVRIEGHTDDVGDDGYNIKLSQSRAEAVKDYLVKQGIDAKRIATQGFGESRPKLKGTSDEIRAQNRRVEMKVIK
ncbi:MAG: PD40 domain-containing protein [Candidatus Kapabacteria bacterium]|nr:PD40 domain-containing protein [Candidatus Kapabacteria bacterium]